MAGIKPTSARVSNSLFIGKRDRLQMVSSPECSGHASPGNNGVVWSLLPSFHAWIVHCSYASSYLHRPSLPLWLSFLALIRLICPCLCFKKADKHLVRLFPILEGFDIIGLCPLLYHFISFFIVIWMLEPYMPTYWPMFPFPTFKSSISSSSSIRDVVCVVPLPELMASSI